MTISPELLAQQLLAQDTVSQKQKGSLYLDDAIVAIFDGLIIFRGDLNMSAAIPILEGMAIGLGLPIAVIERQSFIGGYNKKKYKIGKHIGPGNWMKNSWNSEEGFDFGFKEKYDHNGFELETEEEKKSTSYTGNSANSYLGQSTQKHLPTHQGSVHSARCSKHKSYQDWTSDDYDLYN